MWRTLPLQRAEAPEDWLAPFEMDGKEGQDSDQLYYAEAWGSPLATIEPDPMLGVEDD
ncbi:MAG: hypothetical protein NWQ24_09720 [Haliea sp.]|nr:hypothetical protein [Haliea sp.]